MGKGSQKKSNMPEVQYPLHPDSHYGPVSGFRKRVRDAVAPWVEAGTGCVVYIQSFRSPLLDNLFFFCSWFGTHMMYMFLLPIFYWFGGAYHGRHIVLLCGFGIYTGNIFKDYLCLPRPPSPPVQRLMKLGAHEYGMPSTHSVNAIVIPIFVVYDAFVLNEGHDPYKVSVEFSLFLALFVTALICFSRLYLGMHCLADVIGGVLAGSLVLVCWMSVIGPAADAYVIHGYSGIVHIVFICLAMIYWHPIGHGACPCYDDSICFLGAMSGALVGESVAAHGLGMASDVHGGLLFHPAPGYSLVVIGLARFLVGSIISVAAKTLVKSVSICVLSSLIHYRSPHLCHHVKAVSECPSSSPSPPTTAPKQKQTQKNNSPKGEFSNKKHQLSKSWKWYYVFDTICLSKYLSYFTVGYSVTCISPLLFHYLGI